MHPSRPPGWFLIDVFSVLPVDALFVLIVGAPQGSLGTLRLIRIIRMFRLVKVVRLLRMSHVIRKYQVHVPPCRRLLPDVLASSR